MLDKMTRPLDFQGNALLLRADRQRVIASNLANADTPGFVARDFRFGDALRAITGAGPAAGVRAAAASAGATASTDPRHIPLPPLPGSSASDARGALVYAVQGQPNLDNNSVDADRERASFADNAVRYEAALRFLNGSAKTMLSAIQGQ